MLDLIQIKSEKNGPKVLILGAVHGNEQAGTKAIRQFLEEMHTLKCGSITFIPICNPKAFEKNVRFIDENLNRVIKETINPKSYEQELGNKICQYIKEHDVILDLHSTHCKDDAPFAFCDHPKAENLNIVKHLEVDYVLQGWPEIYKNSAIEDASTESFANKCGKIATTVECGYHFGSMGQEIAYSCIINTLKTLNMIEGKAVENKNQKHIKMDCFVTKTKAGKFVKNYQHLDFIKNGTLIARYDDGEEIIAVLNSYILIPNHEAQIGTEWFYLGQLL